VTLLRRASSFVLLTAQKASSADQAHLEVRSRPSNGFCGHISGGPVFDGMLELVLRVFLDQVWNRKDFSGFSLFAKVPPGFQEHQAYFESYLWRKILGQLTNRIH